MEGQKGLQKRPSLSHSPALPAHSSAPHPLAYFCFRYAGIRRGGRRFRSSSFGCQMEVPGFSSTVSRQQDDVGKLDPLLTVSSIPIYVSERFLKLVCHHSVALPIFCP